MTSIRRFLTVAMVTVVVGTALILLGVTYHTVRHEMDEQYDADLVQTAKLIAAFWRPGAVPDPSVIVLGDHEHRYQRYFSYQLWQRGHLLLASDGAPATPMLPLEHSESGGRYLEKDGWHAYGTPLSGDRWVVVAQSDHERRSLILNVVAAVLAPYVVSLPFVVLLIWLAIRRGLLPLLRLSRAVAARHADNLAPLGLARPVRELSPLVNEINTLLARLDGALEREKRFTADAAHELRTLLMVLKLHADNAATLDDPAEVTASMRQLQRAIDRASRTVAQLLELARLNPQLLATRGNRCDAAAVARDTLATLASLAEQHGQSLALEMDASAPVALPAEALQMALRNLVDNACRYSPSGSRIRVIGERRGDRLRILITDGGPGLTPAERERFLGRFSRGHGDVPGAGLGLSIVDRILSLYGGTLHYRLRTDEVPAAAVMELPPA